MYVVIHMTRRFIAYFLVHPIKFFTEYALRRYLHKPKTLGRLTRWVIELGEFKIYYAPTTTIEGQEVANFIAEVTEFDQSIPWVVEVDGYSCNTSVGLGIKIITLDQRIYE